MADDDKRTKLQLNKLKLDSRSISRSVKKAETVTTRHAHKFIIKRLDSVRSARRQIVSWLLLVGIMIAAVGLQVVWFQRDYTTTSVADGGTYAEAALGPIETLNPLYATTNAEVAASHLLFSSLYTYDDTGHLRGDLARSMSVDSTGRVYTITLNPNVYWHDGTKVTAQDVAFTVNLIKNPEARSPLRINWQDVGVRAIDDTTVQFQLPATYAAFPYALTFSVLPQHILASVPASNIRENTFSRQPVGSGPFALQSMQSAQTGTDNVIIHLKAFSKYSHGTPKLAHFDLHAYSSRDEILTALKTGEVNAAADLSASQAEKVDTHNYNVISRPVDNGVYALFNLDNPILKDKTVRKALQLGTDTAQIRRNLPGKVPALDLPFVRGQLTGTGIPHAPMPDQAAAAKMLDGDGWKLVNGVRQKGKTRLSLTITTTTNDDYETAVRGLQSQWQQLGVDVKTNVIDTNGPSVNFVQNILQPRSYDVLVYELLIGADPDVYAYWHSSQIGQNGYNFSNYSDMTSDALLTSARARLEPALRNAKYIAFASQWLADAPAIGIYQPVAQYVEGKQVSSLDSSSTLISSTDRYADILYWTVGETSVYKTP